MQSGDCWTCRHSIGVNQGTVRRLFTHRGYRDGGEDERRRISIVCEPRRIFNCKPCGKWEREPGSDDE